MLNFNQSANTFEDGKYFDNRSLLIYKTSIACFDRKDKTAK